MNLADVQSSVEAVLRRHPELHHVPIVLDDGTGEATPGRAAALKKQGLCLLVWRVPSCEVASSSKTGAVLLTIPVHVFVEESVSVCRGESGLNMTAETAAQHVLQALSGARVGAERIVLDSQPMENLGRVNGTNQILISAVAELTLSPLVL